MLPKIKLFALLVIISLGLTVPEASFSKELKMPTFYPPSEVDRCLSDFIKGVSDLSQGEIEIKPYPINAIIPIKDYLEATRRGAMKISLFPEAYYEKLIPVSTIAAGLPFGVRSLDEAWCFMYEKGFIELLQKGYEEKGVHIIPFMTYKVGLMTKQPINKMEDFNGMKLRSYGAFAEWLMKMGATTIYVPGGELYTALSTGVVDGAHWGDAGTMYVLKFHEVLKNYMVPEPLVSWASLAVNMKYWKSLSPLQQKILEASAMAYGQATPSYTTRTLGKTSLAKMVDEAGVKVNVLPEAEIAKMQAASMQVWDDVAKKDELSAKGIELLKAYMKELGYLK